MSKITVLDQATINKIAAGEVVERPSSVVKELVENAIDANATAITVEIKEGGISFIRVTDNGAGMEKEDVTTAFLRHATSKIKSALDLLLVGSLGFRGEALSSICAVSQVELLTKTKNDFIGTRYVIEGGEEKILEEAGCPSGTTFLVRNLFYNTPARKKFLKSAVTEGGHINELLERLALSRPEISFKYMNNGKTILHTTGNRDIKEIIYYIYGKDIASSVISIPDTNDDTEIKLTGYIGKPVIAKGNRSHENYFVNGRYVKCSIITRAIEDAYQSYMMGHKYPFTVIHITVPPDFIDVNVHPTKMELRFADNEKMYHIVYDTIRNTLSGKNMIVPISLSEKEDKKIQQQLYQKQKTYIPEPFEIKRKEQIVPIVQEQISTYQATKPMIQENISSAAKYDKYDSKEYNMLAKQEPNVVVQESKPLIQPKQIESQEQLTLPLDLLSKDTKKEFHLIGQLFATYWLIEMEEQLFIVDQHAAHEKVLFERMMQKLHQKEEIITQNLVPPMILSLTLREADCLKRNIAIFEKLGFILEDFGGLEYKVTAVPADFVTVDHKELLLEVLDTLLTDREFKNADIVLEKVASLSCKAAVKGNHRMSELEAKQLISDMLTLENPYHCPHGRPTTISMSKQELERRFKRII